MPIDRQGSWREIAREQRDLAVEKLRAKYAVKVQTLVDQKRRAEQKLEKDRKKERDMGFSL